jgi:hypothetical protein
MISNKFKISKLRSLTSILFILTLVSCDESPEKGFSLDGFKEVKFGVNVNKLIDMGVNCEIEPDSIILKSCEMSNSAETKFTLFGQKTRLYVQTSDHKVAAIGVYIEFPPDYLIEQFTSSLGAPDIYNYVSVSGYNVNKYYWVSRNGTAIIVTKNLDKNQSVDTVEVTGMLFKIKKSSSAEYLGQIETEKFLKQVPPAPSKNDF